MAYPNDNPGRVGQSRYWFMFVANMVAVTVLLVGGLAMLFTGAYIVALLMLFAVIPVGIYWRVIMMRRCRDIGWPAFLPWLFFGLQFVVSFTVQLGSLTDPSNLSLLSLPLLLATADFVFSIVIGCIGTKQEPDHHGRYGVGNDPRSARAGHGSGESDEANGGDRFDDAIARALEKHRRGESVLDAAPRAAPTAPTRPTFGRRVV